MSNNQELLPVRQAIEIVIAGCPSLNSEKVALAESRGRVLAENIVADTDLPPFDRSQMDGYAVRAVETRKVPARLRIMGESAAGHGWHQELQSGQAVRIMTGAPVPEGADAVQQVEKTHEVDGSVEILETVAEGRSIVRRGAEIKEGDTVLQRGEQVTAAAVAVLASFGYAHVEVSRKPRISVLATGSELVSVHQKPGQDQIRDSNNYSLNAYAELAGAVVTRLALSNDNPDVLGSVIAGAAEEADVIVTSGGVSVGAYDFTKDVLRDLGAEIFFERVALRPGKPTVFAKLPSGTLVFGLPGNPVSVSVTFNLFARTALLAMQGARKVLLESVTAQLAHGVKGSADRDSYLPATTRTDDHARLIAEPLKWGGSSDFVAFARATALVIVPAGTASIDPGEKVSVLRLPS
jgi:molybdenum cofactor synthesis domain-containing protein